MVPVQGVWWCKYLRTWTRAVRSVMVHVSVNIIEYDRSVRKIHVVCSPLPASVSCAAASLSCQTHSGSTDHLYVHSVVARQLPFMTYRRHYLL